jgi:hypothetical protein
VSNEADDPLAVRVQRLRAQAEWQGLRLSECRTGSEIHAVWDCTYTLSDERDTRPSAQPGMSLDEVETYLKSIGATAVWDATGVPGHSSGLKPST